MFFKTNEVKDSTCTELCYPMNKRSSRPESGDTDYNDTDYNFQNCTTKFDSTSVSLK